MVGFKKDLNFIHNCPCIKGTVMQLKKNWKMMAHKFQKYLENFAFHLFIILK